MTWAAIDRALLEVGIAPQQADSMTIAEIEVACRDPNNPHGEPGGSRMSPEDVRDYFEWWEKLTPQERLFAEWED